MKPSEEVDDYISKFPKDVQTRLSAVRKIIKKHAPGAEESISWSMPSYKMNKYICFFAGHKNHIGFYPLPSAIRQFQEKIKGYKASKGSIQFPHDRPLPKKLIADMVIVRVKEDMKLSESRTKPKRG